VIIALFLIIAPTVDPGALRTREAPPRFYPTIIAFISGFLLLATCVVFATSLGYALSVPRVMLAGFGLLMAVIGNYLGKMPKNYVVGIRTPWTLSSDYVWERTHRFAAPLFFVVGVSLSGYCLVRQDSLNFLIIGAIIAVTLLAPYCYSYVTWKRTLAADAT
jgi:uncharacterized membrane protein